MKLRPLLTAALVVLLVVPVVARAPEFTAAHIDPAVAFVTTGCDWSPEKDGGTVRVVVLAQGFEHVTSQVFFQWLTASRDEGGQVLNSVAVSAINDPGVWSVGQPVIDIDTHEGCTFRLPATNSYSLEPTEFVVKVGAPGEFETKQVHQ